MNRIERWPNDKVRQIWQHISRHEMKRRNLSLKFTEHKKTKPKQRSNLNDRDSHIHVQTPSTITCWTVTSYHNIPKWITSSASRSGWEHHTFCHWLTYWHTEFLHKDLQSWEDASTMLASSTKPKRDLEKTKKTKKTEEHK